MAKRGTGLGMSFLDVLCSAMGGMIVLAVIFSIIKNPTMVPKTREFILLQVPCKEDQKLGLMVTTPTGQQHAILPNDPSDDLGSAATGLLCRLGEVSGNPISKNILYVEIREPAIGVWRFQPYFVDWAPRGVAAASVGEVRIWTSNGPLTTKEAKDGQPVQERSLPATGHLDSKRFEVEIKK